MATYLLTWNPEKYPWDEIEEEIEMLDSNGELFGRWSCGGRKNILPGDRLFLLRQGLEPRGIVASGWALSNAYTDAHWGDEEKTANYVEVHFEKILNPEKDQILSREELDIGILGEMHWNTQSSGVVIRDDIAKALEDEWEKYMSKKPEFEHYYASDDKTSSMTEGEMKTISVQVYERNRYARKLCISKYGAQCTVCGFDFERTYGEIGKGFIHVHHIKPISEIGKTYILNPINDLRPLCPNCHSMIHRTKETITIEELKKRIRR